MPITIDCKSCGRLMFVPDSDGGREVRCPYCGMRAVVPLPVMPQAASPTPVQPLPVVPLMVEPLPAEAVPIVVDRPRPWADEKQDSVALIIRAALVYVMLGTALAIMGGISKEIVRQPSHGDYGTHIMLKSIRGLIVDYQMTNGHFPAAGDSRHLVEQLSTLNDADVKAVVGRHLEDGRIKDVWGTEIMHYEGRGPAPQNIRNLYEAKNRVPILASAGPDREFGTEDDFLDPTP